MELGTRYLRHRSARDSLDTSCLIYIISNSLAVPQLVTLPYNLLLMKRSREALEIDLADQVVIIDEAHSTFTIQVSRLLDR